LGRGQTHRGCSQSVPIDRGENGVDELGVDASRVDEEHKVHTWCAFELDLQEVTISEAIVAV
jgi:hypothetical protein